MSNTIWSSIVATLSVCIGFILSEAGVWFRSRTEKYKIRNRAISYLLDIHHIFTTLNVAPSLEIMTQKISERHPEIQKDELEDVLNKLYQPLILAYLKKQGNENISKLEENYKSAIDNLSPIDPIIAYRLRGRTNIILLFDQLSDHFKTVGEQLGSSTELKFNMEEMFSLMEPKIHSSALQDIKADILELALKTNWRRYFKIKKILREKMDEKEEGEKIDNWLDKIDLILINATHLTQSKIHTT